MGGAEKMKLRYSLDDRPPIKELLAFGLQWFAISIPTIVIIGKIVASVHSADATDQVLYLQKMTFVVGVGLCCQILWGHGLPLLLGPSSALLIGILSSRQSGSATIYGSILAGGLLLAGIGSTGLFGRIRQLFTIRVVAVVLLLIAFTLTPTVIQLMTGIGNPVSPLLNLTFSLVLLFAMAIAYRFLRGIWRLTLIIWAIMAGTAAYFLIFPTPSGHLSLYTQPTVSFFFRDLTTTVSFESGVLISFLFSFLALTVNDFGSIQSLNEILKPSDAAGRINRGLTMTGLANVLAGFLGVVGPVNFSLSPGVIMATRCASRLTLLPAAALLFLISFSPVVIAVMGAIPSVVVGAVLAYLLSSQVIAGLSVLLQEKDGLTFEGGLVVGIPVLVAIVIAFLPAAMLNEVPLFLKPIVGNGFAVGLLICLVLEHLVFRRQEGPTSMDR
jgi:xanthine/uracil permease